METEMKKNLPAKETVLEQLNWRYAVKKFDSSKQVSDEDWQTLERTLILAPSSYGLQPYKFVVVTDEEMKEKLKAACYGQPQITDSSHLVIFMARKELGDEIVEEYIERLIEVRGTPRESLEDYINMMKGTMTVLRDNNMEISWSQRQAYIALGFLLETAAVLGIDACPMEGFEPDKVDEILGLEGYTASVLCTLGYRSDEDWLAGLKKVRLTEEKLIVRI
jgi:nitroreductase